MGKETVLFKNEEKVSNREAADLLRKLADKIEKGKVILSLGGKETVLKIPERVEVEVKAEREEGKKKTTKKLEVEIEWRVGDKAKAHGPLKVK